MTRLFILSAVLFVAVTAAAADKRRNYVPCIEKAQFERQQWDGAKTDRSVHEKPQFEKHLLDVSFQQRHEVAKAEFEKPEFDTPAFERPCDPHSVRALEAPRSKQLTRVDILKKNNPHTAALKRVKVGTLQPGYCPCEKPLSARPIIVNGVLVSAR